jgi:predicted TIM-barrel fold metal-dependent hydrolase
MTDRTEEPLWPELPVCDAHHHLWEHASSIYMMPEFTADTGSGHRVVRTVFVECGSGYKEDGPLEFRPVGETEFVVRADPSGTVAGIIGHADLRVPGIADVLAAHIEAGAGRFRGVRQVSAWNASPEIRPGHTNPPPGLLGDGAFRSGFAALGRAGLSFDAWLYHPQLPELADLARSQEGVPIVIDHLGGPLGIGPYRDHRNDVLAVWRSGMQELAAFPNVFLKLGGIGMPIFGMGWHKQPDPTTSEALAAAWAAEIRWCIEQFGVERCMFESNFPVDKPSCTYVVLWNAFKRIVMSASSNEKEALFHETAAKVYRLIP